MKPDLSSGTIKLDDQRGGFWPLARWYSAVLLLMVLVYGVTCAPGALWQDSGMIQYRVWHTDIEGRLGLALSHPLYYLIAIPVRYFPWGEFGHRVNLVTAVCSAVAVANLFLLVRLWTGKLIPAVIAALSLGLSHTFWRHAAICETYNLYIALLLAEWIMLLQYQKTGNRKYLYGLAFINGLALADHMLASLAFVCYAALLVWLLIRKRIMWHHVGIMALLWILGALPYEFLIVKNMVQTGDVAGTLASAAFGHGYQGDVLNTAMSLRIIKENVLFLFMNFPTPNLLLAFMGLSVLFRVKKEKVKDLNFLPYVFIGLLVLFLLFAFRYTVVDRYAFFIPFYTMISILIGLGAWHLLDRVKVKWAVIAVLAFSLLPVPAYAIAPEMAQRFYPALGGRRAIPYRDNYQYFLQPWRTGYHGAERFGTEALEQVEEGATIYADNTTVYALLYMQEVHGLRPDVKIVSEHVSSVGVAPLKEADHSPLLDVGHLYVVSDMKGYYPEILKENGKFKKAGVLFKVYYEANIE